MRGACWLIALMLAGCVAPVPDPAAKSSAVISAARAFSLEGCEYVAAFLRVPPAIVADKVPPEFALSLDVGGVAIASTGALRCPGGAYGWLGVNIEAPKDSRLRGNASAGVTIYQFSLQRFAARDDFASALAAEGIDAELGEIAVTLGSAPSSRVDAAGAHYGIIEPVGPDTGGEGNVDYEWRSIAKIGEGYQIVSAHLQPNPSRAGTGAGAATFSAGSVGAQIFGASHPGLVSYGSEYALRDGTLQMIASAAVPMEQARVY